MAPAAETKSNNEPPTTLAIRTISCFELKSSSTPWLRLEEGATGNAWYSEGANITKEECAGVGETLVGDSMYDGDSVGEGEGCDGRLEGDSDGANDGDSKGCVGGNDNDENDGGLEGKNDDGGEPDGGNDGGNIDKKGDDSELLWCTLWFLAMDGFVASITCNSNLRAISLQWARFLTKVRKLVIKLI